MTYVDNCQKCTPFFTKTEVAKLKQLQDHMMNLCSVWLQAYTNIFINYTLQILHHILV